MVAKPKNLAESLAWAQVFCSTIMREDKIGDHQVKNALNRAGDVLAKLQEHAEWDDDEPTVQQETEVNVEADEIIGEESEELEVPEVTPLQPLVGGGEESEEESEEDAE